MKKKYAHDWEHWQRQELIMRSNWFSRNFIPSLANARDLRVMRYEYARCNANVSYCIDKRTWEFLINDNMTFRIEKLSRIAPYPLNFFTYAGHY